MITDDLQQAAQLLIRACQDGQRMTMLPPAVQPTDLEQGYQSGPRLLSYVFMGTALKI